MHWEFSAFFRSPLLIRRPLLAYTPYNTPYIRVFALSTSVFLRQRSLSSARCALLRRILRYFMHASALFSAAYALFTEKHPGEGGCRITESQPQKLRAGAGVSLLQAGRRCPRTAGRGL
jgi:hypothetical protein